MKKLFKNFIVAMSLVISSIAHCTVYAADGASPNRVAEFNSIYWSDGDSGRLGSLKFRLANIDAPETGSMKQRGGAKCEFERQLGFEAKAYVVGFTKNKTISIVRDYGEDRYGRLVIDLDADGSDVAKAGVDAGHLRDWLHINGRAQSAKPNWCTEDRN